MASSGEEDSGEAAPAPATIKLRYCSVYDCLNSHKTRPDIAYFGFPSDRERVKIWTEKIRRPDIVQPNGRVSSYYRVCEVHFLPRHVHTNNARRRLTRSAVPTRRLPHPGSYVAVHQLPGEQPTQTVAEIHGKTLVRSTPETFEYVPEASKPSKKRKKGARCGPLPRPPAPPALETFFAHCDSELPQNTADLVKRVARLQTLHNSLDDCLKLLHLSPQTYRLLQPSLGLPSVSTLHRHCAPRLPDLKTTIDVLKVRVSRMTQLEKHCTLSVDIIDTRPNLYYNITFDRIVGLHEVNGEQSPSAATRAVIVTAKGLLVNWTQPVALCYLARDDDAFNLWIDNIICSLNCIGLTVHALVCDPTGPVVRYVSPEQPFFTLNDTKIYFIYDPPRLMKMLLIDFIDYDFHFEKTIAKWSDVYMYRKIERNKPLTLTPGLTDACIDPVAVGRMRAARVARILSHSLAVALTNGADQGLLEESARTTAAFIIKINNLYALLSSTQTKGLEFKKGLQDPSQIGFLTYMKSFFKSLQLKNSSGVKSEKTKKLSVSWQITIEAVLALREEIQPLRPSLLTKKLHLDDSVSEKLRCVATKPSCREVFNAFKKQFLHEMLQPIGKERKDLNGLLAQVTGEDVRPLPMDVDEERVQGSDYRSFQLPKHGSLSAVAMHLLGAAARAHGACPLAAGYLHAPPEPDFLQLVRDLDEALAGALSDGASARAFLRDLLLDVHVLDCALPCACFPLDDVKRLFFRLRLYSLLRYNQKRFKSGKDDLEYIMLE